MLPMVSLLFGKSSKTENAEAGVQPGAAEWHRMVDQIPANVMMADAEFRLVYANPAAVRTLETIADQVRETFNVELKDLMGGSIHRFHRNPHAVEEILRDPRNLPHTTEFSFGGVTLSATINGVREEAGELTGYIVSWEDVTARATSEAHMTRLTQMVENLPTNVIFADRDNIVRYMNPASSRTLKSIQHLLPMPVDSIVGSSIDAFHKDPSYQQRILADPSNLPVESVINLGDQVLDLLVSPIYDKAGAYIGAMASWSVVTEAHNTKQEARRVSDAVTQSAGEMSQTIKEISSSVYRTADKAKEADELSRQTTAYVGELNDHSGEIGRIIEVIRDLSDQTNLLALNATIEAARAGESGRSFAVVAEEVKTLAHHTAESVEGIESLVGQIRGSIDQVTGATNSINESVEAVSRDAATIASAVEEQSVTMGRLSEMSETLNKITQ
ncbi:MAG: methyl-accepting chemotaxis protein [Planctomycetota bacterium]